MKIMESCGYDDSFQLRDARYDQVVHMMTAANGAEDFYQLDNPARSEGLELARDLDSKAANVSGRVGVVMWASCGISREYCLE